MVRIIIYVVWCLLGFCIAVGGCRAALTAEKLEASVTISRDPVVEPATVEVHYDTDRGGNERVEADAGGG